MMKRKPRKKRELNDRDRAYAQAFVRTGSYTDAAAAIQLKNPQRNGYRYFTSKPYLQAYIAELKAKTDEKTIEKVSEKIASTVALSLDMADKRLEELLSCDRLDEEKMAIASNLGRTKAGVDLIRDKGLAVTGAARPRISDIALLKAIDITYKRKEGYPKQASQQQLMMQQFLVQSSTNREQGGVYEPAWIREQYGTDNPTDAELERGIDRGKLPTTMGAEDKTSS